MVNACSPWQRDHAQNRPCFGADGIWMAAKNESFRANKRYLMVNRMLAVLPSLTTLIT